MTPDGKALPFTIGRTKGGLIDVRIPMTAAIVTVVFLGASRHHKAACSVVGDLAHVITVDDLNDNLEGSLKVGALKIKEGLEDNRHKPLYGRFMDIGNTTLQGFIHPTELYAMALSAEAFLDDLTQEDPTLHASLSTWARGASRFVTDREMLATYEDEAEA